MAKVPAGENAAVGRLAAATSAPDGEAGANYCLTGFRSTTRPTCSAGRTRFRLSRNRVATKVPAAENATIGRLTAVTSAPDGEAGVNHYLTGFPKYDKADLLRWADAIQALA